MKYTHSTVSATSDVGPVLQRWAATEQWGVGGRILLRRHDLAGTDAGDGEMRRSGSAGGRYRNRATCMLFSICLVLVMAFGSLDVAVGAVEYWVVAQSGDRPYPAIAFIEFDSFHEGGLFPQSPSINNLGEVVLWTRLTGGGFVEGVNADHLLYRDPLADGWQYVAQQGQPAPGTLGGDFLSFERPQIDADGTVVFKALLDEPFTQDEVVYTWSQGVAAPDAFFEETLSEASPDVQLRLGTSAVNLIEPDGYVAISSRLSGPGVAVGVNNYALVTRNVGTGAVELSFRRGLPVLGTSLGIISKVATEPAGGLNRVALVATLDGPVAGADTAILIYESGGSVTAVAREGDSVPGVADAVFADLANVEIAYKGGDIAFSATISGGGVVASNDRGLWVGPPATPVLRLREGSPAPGLPGRTIGFISTVAINAEGRLAVRASVAPGEFALFLEDDAGVLVPVAYPGLVSPAAGDERIIGQTYFFNGLRGMNDSGEVIFTVQYPGSQMMVLTARIAADASGGGATGGGSSGGEATGGGSDVTRPTVRIDGGKKQRTKLSRYRVKGRASDEGEVVKVEYRIGNKKWRKAKGLLRWRVRKPVKLDGARERVRARSIDAAGNVSRVRRQVIIPR